jgi:hypothetical protein
VTAHKETARAVLLIQVVSVVANKAKPVLAKTLPKQDAL